MKLETAQTLDLLGKLLTYPTSEMDQQLAETAMYLETQPEARSAFQPFAYAMGSLTPEEREAQYTQTFDLSPVCAPYVGLYLFGEENFQRAELMARLREAFLDKGFKDDGDLPDHISLLIRFIPKLFEANARELFDCCLRQPMAEMALKLKKSESPYYHLMESVFAVLSGEFQKEPACV